MKTFILFSLLIIIVLLSPQLSVSAQSTDAVADSSLSCSSPDILHSTFVGEGQTENGNSLTLDANGNVFVAGTTFSTTFPPPSRTEQHGVDAIMVGFNPDLSLMSSQLWVNVRPDQPDDEDAGTAIGVDAAGNKYFVGRTRTVDFCNAVGENLPGHDTVYDENGSGDGFLVKIRPDGTPAYCTFVGGNQLELARGLYVYPNGEVIVTGGTFSTDFPVTTGVANAGLRDAFLTKYSADGTQIIWSTLIGGTGQEAGLDVDVDAAGNVYLVGWTFSDDLPVTAGAVQSAAGSGVDSFVVKLSSDGITRSYVTYLGGDGEDRGNAIAVTDAGEAVVVGATSASNFPTTANAVDPTYNGDGFSGHDAFISMLNASGTSLMTSTYLGGLNEERAFDVVVERGEAYVTGFTKSEAFPLTANALDSTLGGGWDAFVLRFDLTDYDLNYSTFFGGSEAERANGIAVAADGRVYITGESRSADLCVTPGAFDTTANGDYDVFITELVAGTIFPPALTISLGQIGASGVASWWVPALLLLFASTSLIIWHEKSKQGALWTED